MTDVTTIHVLTIFPEAFEGYLESSLIGKARSKGLVAIDIVDVRQFARDRHRSTDDAPYGGGAGMVMLVEPLVDAIESVDVDRTVLLTPQGHRLEQRDLARLAKFSSLSLVCGRYEGFDERVRAFVDEEISIGDFVLNGGEVGAMVILDGLIRLLPGVLGNPQSLAQESHADRLLEYPQYTRPAEFRGVRVPAVLLSGDHGAVEQWRRKQALLRTRQRRPDLWQHRELDDRDRELLEEEE